MKRFLFSILSLIIFCTACFGGAFILSGCDKANEKAGGGFEESKIENNASGNWTDSGNYASSFAGGNGRTSPYLIETPQQLARMAYLVNNSDTTATYNRAYYKLIADIDLSAYDWVAIVAFRGVFEGGGHTITGLDLISGQYNGLFMSVIDAKISNIIIGNNNETINLTSYRAGAIAGYAGGSTLISHCTIYSNIEAGSGATGGIVGYATDTAKIEYCKNLGNFIRTSSSSPVIQSDFSTGGIVGQIKVDGTTGVVISKCYNEAQVSGICYVGGIVGSAIYTVNEEFPEGISIFNEIKNCYNTGEIRGNYYVGGIIGKSAYMYSGVHIGDALSLSNCYNSSIIRANDSTQSEFLGGIAGDIGVAKNCFALTEIMGISLSSTQTHRAGILFGRAYCCLEQAALSFSMCYYSGNVRSPYGVAAYSADTTIINLEEGLVRATPSVQFVDEEFFRDTSNWYGDGDSDLLWDFDNVWAIDENINNSYPYLKKPTQTVRVYSASQILELTSDEVDFENAVWQVDSGNFYK